MPITFPCPIPKCSSHHDYQKLRAKDEKAGHTLPCPVCKTQITVPSKEVVNWLEHIKLIQSKDENYLLRERLALTNNELNAADWHKYIKMVKSFGSDLLSQVQMAIASKNTEVLKWFLKHPAIVHAADAKGETLMHCAVFGGNVEVMKFLKDKGAKIDARIKNPGQSLDDDMPIHIAAVNGHYDAVKWLLEQDKKLVNIPGHNGRTPMHQAAAAGKVKVMQLLHEWDKRVVNDKCDDGYQPIHYAAMHDQTESMKCLVGELGADVNAPNNDGAILWDFLVMRGDIEMQQWLQERGAAPQRTVLTHFTNIFEAAMDGTVEDVKRFVEQGVSVDARDDSDDRKGMTPLHFAAMNGNIELIRGLVLELRASINIQDSIGVTPIFAASVINKIESMNCLYALGADPNIPDNEGITIKEYADMVGNTRLQEWLRDHRVR